MIRLRTGPAALFSAIFVLALILLLPLRFALGWFDLDRTGFAARAASGSVWGGSLREAQLGSIALGDVDAALSP
ncbi:MAG: type II secretion system protein N, partial [Sphingomonas sp.]|nr:type II secretion system protein N [Sphingomonas sp.]